MDFLYFDHGGGKVVRKAGNKAELRTNGSDVFAAVPGTDVWHAVACSGIVA